ncbi:MAG: glutathione peroxidase [Rugosibacter sp.]|jgi:glutathione peroxidase|nr:glutathione peroxidase [Rugosibacter sp.]
MSAVYGFTAQAIDGRLRKLTDYRDQVLLIVNVASRCGFTPQYAGLEALWQKYRERGLVVLGFPCNQFGGQEPWDEAAIAGFCSSKYDVSFPLLAKVEVNGDAAHPLWRHLKKAAPGVLGSERIKWNFTKFLVNRAGQVVKRYGPITRPEQISADIERLL